MRILIADDDEDTRLLLSRFLGKSGHDVFLANDGEEAWDLLQANDIRFVISDWLMPHMTGPQLCERIRAVHTSKYIYIMLLTSKNTKEELVEGMKAGADDFLGKPFNRGELEARVRAGERVINLEQNLQAQNKALQKAYERLTQDLEAAADLQRNLLPLNNTAVGGVKFNWLFHPCNFIAGDIFNFFLIDESRVGFYLLDVVGHGVPAAMRSVTISQVISFGFSGHVMPDGSANFSDRGSPAKQTHALNERFQSEHDMEEHFTMVYGVLDRTRNRLSLTQAGHPYPILVSRQGKTSLLGSGGFPVGMFPNVDYDEIVLDFHFGDRLFLYSDGITECMNEHGEQYSVQRLLQQIEQGKGDSGETLLSALDQDLCRWKGNTNFNDDISCLTLEYTKEFT